MDEIKIDILELDYNKPADRKLIKLFEYYFHLNKRVENPEQATKELIETYMALVRSHNNLRRNWHPRESHACDTVVWSVCSKPAQKNVIIDELKKAINISSNGDKELQQKAFEEIADNIIKRINKNNKRKNYSHLESIVRGILKIIPKATYRDVIYELDSKHDEYGIVYMDTEKIIIEYKVSKGHRTKEWKLSRIKNILRNIKNSPP